MRSTRVLLASVFVLFLFACGGGASKSVLLLSVTPQEVPGDGGSSVKVVVRAIVYDAPVKDGTTINVVATGGTFDLQREDQTSTSVRTVAGEGTATWYAPPYDPQGDNQYRITASYKDRLGGQQQAQTTVKVTEATPVDGLTFSFTCSAKNVALPQSGSPPLELPCNVVANDTSGNQVPFDFQRFGFLTETGTFGTNMNGDLVWIVAPGQAPVDVDPLGDMTSGEPRWVDPATGKTHNPRDGIATLVIHTRGMPTGTPDPLQGEPYVDVNDNGQWDQGEAYFDADGNGAYTPLGGNVGATRIWRWVKIFLTGPVSEQAALDSGIGLWNTPNDSMIVDIPYGAKADLSLTLVDENLNPPASHSRGGTPDSIRIETTPTFAQVTPDNISMWRDLATVVFQPSGTIEGGSLRATWLQGLKSYPFSIINNIGSTSPDTAWQFRAITIRRTPDPTDSTMVTETLSPTRAPQGTLLANPN